MPHRAVEQRLLDILSALERVQAYCEDLTFEQFSGDTRTVEAVQFNFMIIGEAARHIPDDITGQHPEVPWAEMRGLRNIVAHAYFAVSLEILWQTVTNDLPPLRPVVRAIVDKQRDDDG